MVKSLNWIVVITLFCDNKKGHYYWQKLRHNISALCINLYNIIPIDG